MADFAKLAGYILGVLITGRIVFLWARKDAEDDDATFTAVAAGILWPLIVFVAVVLAPLIAIGWLVSLPTRSERRAKRDANASGVDHVG